MMHARASSLTHLTWRLHEVILASEGRETVVLGPAGSKADVCTVARLFGVTIGGFHSRGDTTRSIFRAAGVSRHNIATLSQRFCFPSLSPAADVVHHVPELVEERLHLRRR